MYVCEKGGGRNAYSISCLFLVKDYSLYDDEILVLFLGAILRKE